MRWAALLLLVVPSTASAWDFGARIGAGKRLIDDQPAGVADGNLGPVGELSAHLALIPLLRVGPVLSMELSPVAGQPTRRHYGAGLEARVFAPLPWQVRPFVYVGVRGVWVHQSASGALGSGSGGYMSIPFGFGVSAPVYPSVRFVMTLGGDGAFAHGGGLYKAPHDIGDDVFGVRGSVGVDFEF